MGKHIYRPHTSSEPDDGNRFPDQAATLMDICLRREKGRDRDEIRVLSKKSQNISEPEFRKDGLLTYIADGLGVPNPLISNWLHGIRHMPVEHLENFDRLMQLDEGEKRKLYGAVILPEETKFDDLFRMKASLSKKTSGEVLMKVRDNCCLSPHGEMVAWRDVMDRLPPEEWPQHQTLTNDMIKARTEGLTDSAFYRSYKNAAEVLKVLDAIPTITTQHKLNFVRAYLLPRHTSPRFGPGTPNKGSGDIVQELIRTHALGIDGKVHSWKWLNEEAEKKDDPHILADARELDGDMVSGLLVEALHKSGKSAPVGSHQMVSYWIGGGKPKESMRIALFDLFYLTEEQREIYDESPSMPAIRRTREHAVT